MCEECEDADVLREVYLARRARMARTWTPRRRSSVDAVPPAAVVVVPEHAEPVSAAAE
jgi:hypothetical protein